MRSKTHFVFLSWHLLVAFIYFGAYSLPTDKENENIGTMAVASNAMNMADKNEHAETCASPLEEFVSPVKGSPRCCRKCQPGTGMLRLCTDVEDTQCRPCDPGSEFSSVHSATTKCQQCRRCQDLHPLAKTRTLCTPTANTECECELGYYMSLPSQTCKPCTKCKPNEGLVKPCEWNADTQCQSCPSGFWSTPTADSVKCIPCRTCTDEQIMVKTCTTNSDTVCCPKFNENCTMGGMDEFDYAAPDSHESANPESGDMVMKQNQMLPIYCSIMGMIIISLLLYVVYKLWKQREAMTTAKLSEVYGNGIGGVDKVLVRSPQPRDSLTTSGLATANVPLAVSTGGNYDAMQPVCLAPEKLSRGRRQKVTNSTGQDTSSQESHPLIDSFSPNFTEPGSMDKPICTLSSQTLGNICYSLAQKGWRELASVSGFSLEEVELKRDACSEPQSTLLLQIIQSAKLSRQIVGEGDPHPSENDIMHAARVIGKLLDRSDMSVKSFCTVLEQVNRLDLVSMITKNGLNPVLNGYEGPLKPFT